MSRPSSPDRQEDLRSDRTVPADLGEAPPAEPRQHRHHHERVTSAPRVEKVPPRVPSCMDLVWVIIPEVCRRPLYATGLGIFPKCLSTSGASSASAGTSTTTTGTSTFVTRTCTAQGAPSPAPLKKGCHRHHLRRVATGATATHRDSGFFSVPQHLRSLERHHRHPRCHHRRPIKHHLRSWKAS